MQKNPRKLALSRETLVQLGTVDGAGYPTTTQAISMCRCPTQETGCPTYQLTCTFTACP